MGSGSRKLLADDSDKGQHDINTDISQFLNTKQTFNHSMTGNTYTEGEKDAMLDRDSAFGGAVNREMAGMAGVVFSKDGSFVHEFSPLREQHVDRVVNLLLQQFSVYGFVS